MTRHARIRAATLLATCATALALTACGGSDDPTPASPSSSAMAGTTTATSPRQDGRALFTTQGCGSCHTLAAGEGTGSFGPDLDTTTLDAAAIARQIRDGGGGMPPFGDAMTPAVIQTLATWVATHRAR